MALTEGQMTNSARELAGPWRYERLDGPGHWMQLEAPDEVNRLLIDFLPAWSASFAVQPGGGCTGVIGDHSRGWNGAEDHRVGRPGCAGWRPGYSSPRRPRGDCARARPRAAPSSARRRLGAVAARRGDPVPSGPPADGARAARCSRRRFPTSGAQLEAPGRSRSIRCCDAPVDHRPYIARGRRAVRHRQRSAPDRSSRSWPRRRTPKPGL